MLQNALDSIRLSLVTLFLIIFINIYTNGHLFNKIFQFSTLCDIKYNKLIIFNFIIKCVCVISRQAKTFRLTK